MAKQAEQTVTVVSGVTMEKLDEPTFKAALAEVGLDANKPLDALVRDLVGYYHGNYEETELYKCDQCGGLSVEADSCCPFCGDPAEALDELKPEDAPAKAEPSPEQKVANAAGEVLTKGKAKGKAAAKPKADKPKGKADKPKAPPKKKPGDSTALVPTDANKKRKSLAPGHKAEVVGQLSKYTVADLDESVERIRTALKATAMSTYDVGEAIRDNYERELWRLRTGDDGKPSFASFQKWCNEEVGISHTWAFTLMDVAASYTRDDVAAIGTTKLTLVLKAPEPVRAKLMEQARAGASKRELEAAVKTAKGVALPTAEDKAKSKRSVAVSLVMGRKTLTMLKRPGSKDEAPMPARTITDQPWARLPLTNGVVMYTRVQQKDTGEFQQVIEFRREED
jgi:hypothetical protein